MALNIFVLVLEGSKDDRSLDKVIPHDWPHKSLPDMLKYMIMVSK